MHFQNGGYRRNGFAIVNLCWNPLFILITWYSYRCTGSKIPTPSVLSLKLQNSYTLSNAFRENNDPWTQSSSSYYEKCALEAQTLKHVIWIFGNWYIQVRRPRPRLYDDAGKPKKNKRAKNHWPSRFIPTQRAVGHLFLTIFNIKCDPSGCQSGSYIPFHAGYYRI